MSDKNYYAALLHVKDDASSSSADEWLPASASRRKSRNANGTAASQKSFSKKQSILERSSRAEPPEESMQGKLSSNGLHKEFPALRLDVGKGDAKENIDSTASNIRSKMHEDIALQQPNEGKSGLYKPLFWVDLEMTGLDLEHDTIIEIACLITDGNLENTLEGPDIAIHHPDSVLSEMNSWCIEHHGSSGLTQRCRDSTTSMEDAEAQVLRFVSEHIQAGEARLAGNSVHVDAAFMRRLMPRLHAHLHHRIVDVSTVAELCSRWYPMDARKMPRKKSLHTAMADIKQSLEQLRYYKTIVFKSKPRR